MGAVLILAIIGVIVLCVVFMWRSFGRPYMELTRKAEVEKAQPRTRVVVRIPVDDETEDLDEGQVTIRTIDPSVMRVVDLSGLDSVRMRIKGTAYWLRWSERDQFGGRDYLLVREPDNDHDGNAIAVYGNGRKVGHLSAARAASMAPVLDGLGADAYATTGTGTSENSGVLWVDVPKLPALRAFAKPSS